jgi:hypothetical protein
MGVGVYYSLFLDLVSLYIDIHVVNVTALNCIVRNVLSLLFV